MRTRTQKRLLEREQKKLDDAKWKLALLAEGYRAERPIVVESASQIEPHVRGMTCPTCDVSYQVTEHVATARERIVRARCAQCGRTPSLHFVLRSSTLS